MKGYTHQPLSPMGAKAPWCGGLRMVTYFQMFLLPAQTEAATGDASAFAGYSIVR